MCRGPVISGPASRLQEKWDWCRVPLVARQGVPRAFQSGRENWPSLGAEKEEHLEMVKDPTLWGMEGKRVPRTGGEAAPGQQLPVGFQPES